MSVSVLVILTIVVISMMVHWRFSDSYQIREQIKVLSNVNEKFDKQLAALLQQAAIRRQELYNSTIIFANDIIGVDDAIQRGMNQSNHKNKMVLGLIAIITMVVITFVSNCIFDSKEKIQKQYDPQFNIIFKEIEKICKRVSNPIDDNSCNRDLFRVFGKTISLLYSKGNSYYQLVGKIPFSQSNSVSFKILNMHKKSAIFIGAINQKYISDPNSINRPGRNLVYYSSEGSSSQKKDKNKGFQVNDTVTMSLSGNTINWSVSGIVKAECISDSLTDQKINWVPCIWMYSLNDAVEWQ